MNQAQFMATLRHLLTLACGYFVGRGWVSENTAMFVVSLVLAAGPMLWTILETTKANLIKRVDALPEVGGGGGGVIMANTTEGKALAMSIPSPTVVPAGTPAAAAVAKDGK